MAALSRLYTRWIDWLAAVAPDDSRLMLSLRREDAIQQAEAAHELPASGGDGARGGGCGGG